tara:strand:- start:583 stop:1575 length:993 start_codon:yes stop_codon:yes gene_type:complete
MVRTGSNAFVHYGVESTFGGGATQTRAFGLEQKVNSLTFKNNQIPLSQLNSIEVQSFAYGKNEGSGSLDFVLSNPWIFDTVLGGVDKTGSTNDYSYIWDSNYSNLSSDNTGVKVPKSFDIEVGFDAKPSKTDVLRNLKGSVINQIAVKSSVGETVKVTMDFLYGIVDTISTSVSGGTTADDINFPYTFAHASLELLDGSAVAEIQDFDINFATNCELLYEQGAANAVGAFRKLFEITGKFNASFIDKTQLQRVIDRTEVATLTVEFTNGLSGTSEKSIKLEFAGVGLSEHSLSIAPVEPIFEDLTFQMRNVKITANNSISKTVASGELSN